MTKITGGQSTIEVSESEGGLVSLRQKPASGEEQTIFLDPHQAESLANWFMQYVRTSREALSEE